MKRLVYGKHLSAENLGRKVHCEWECPEQNMRLNMLFVVASITTNVSCLLAGTTLDRFGRRACITIAVACLTAGSLSIASKIHLIGADGYLVGHFLLGLGGTFLFLPSFQLSNAFPEYSGIVVAMITCAFDASAAVLSIYSLAWTTSGGTFTVSKFFLAYLAVPLAILVVEWTIMPDQPYPVMPDLERKIADAQSRSRNICASNENLAGDTEERNDIAQQEAHSQAASGAWVVLQGLSASRQMRTPWFVLLLLATTLQMLRMNYFIANIKAQCSYLLGSDADAETVNKFFDAALPIGGVAAMPLIAIILNNLSVARVLALLTAYMTMNSALSCLPLMWACIATVVTFVTFRPFYYATISHTAAEVFGFATFGRMYGTIICASGLLNIFQSSLDSFTYGALRGDPTPVNIALAVTGAVLGAALTSYAAYQGRA
ncbi:cysteine proteinase [Purpureocillium lavendulum]|uniref:Cysteine proteinase n=1 Tax=Purpureocillium lavendulum TaxID=1247861 RepID=A0AB34FLA1_9HYPO|nr:cysteine proteinase [Purpureocillium lavendulum]